jgi:hypothetical protein
MCMYFAALFNFSFQTLCEIKQNLSSSGFFHACVFVRGGEERDERSRSGKFE